jgi:hypothetical protein
VSKTVLSVREEFPGIMDPLQTALAEAGKVAELLANRGLEPGAGRPADGSRPAGEPLAARDAYGSRLVLTAPFSYDRGAPDHWYAWDIDLCWIAVVAGAGVFASAQDALPCPRPHRIRGRRCRLIPVRCQPSGWSLPGLARRTAR